MGCGPPVNNQVILFYMLCNIKSYYQDCIIGNPYGSDVFEPAPRLQAAVAALSAGPLAVGDKIGISDTDLIMRCCRAVRYTSI